ncbi:MAG: glycosyl transferase family 1 [Nonlabens sp.]
MTRKLLIICYYWPPAGGPGVQRWLKFATYLTEFDFEVTVLVPDNPDYPILDQSLLADVPDSVNVLRASIFEPSRLVSSLSRKRTKSLQRGIISKQKSYFERIILWLRGNLFIPDARIFWVKKLIPVAQDYLNLNPEAAIITTGPPHSVHLGGLHLKTQNNNLKWIADFRDPWTTIGYHKKLSLGTSAKKKHLELENKVLKNADMIVVTSPHTQAEFESKTQVPVKVVTNGFDVEVNQNIEQPEGKFTVSHVGTLLSDRNPEILWDVLSELCREQPSFAKDLSIQLAGNLSRSILKKIDYYGLTDLCAIKGYISHDEATELMFKSQCLLLIEIDSNETKAIVPGKLFEYLASKRPILAIGPEEASVEQMIHDNEAGIYHSYKDRSKLKDSLLKFYKLYKSGNNLANQCDHIHKYHRRETTRLLVTHLNDLWE